MNTTEILLNLTENQIFNPFMLAVVVIFIMFSVKFTMLTFFVVNFSVMFTNFGHIHLVKWIALFGSRAQSYRQKIKKLVAKFSDFQIVFRSKILQMLLEIWLDSCTKISSWNLSDFYVKKCGFKYLPFLPYFLELWFTQAEV